MKEQPASSGGQALRGLLDRIPGLRSSARLEAEAIRMARDWDRRAREQRAFSEDGEGVESGHPGFFESGRKHVEEQVLGDLGNIARRQDPKSMRVLEIGCGQGRLTRALAGVFGEVHAVDVSPEMIERARGSCAGLDNVFLYRNNGYSLDLFQNDSFDFAYSQLAFRHIPSLEVIASYLGETARVLKVGALFKVQLQGDLHITTPNTWVGTPVSPEQASRMAKRSGFDLRFSHGAGSDDYWLWLFKYTPEESLEAMSELMEHDWDERARSNAEYYINTAAEDWSSEEFYATGRATVEQYVLNDMENVCQEKDPRQMRVLEIGCGAGRITRALAEIFGEVHAVDVSGEMVEKARRALASQTNAHVYKNNGRDLRAAPGGPYDFIFSYVVFQHIPSRRVIERYVREAYRVLRKGGLFKFQVQGAETVDVWDTWVGAPLPLAEAQALADRRGFELRHWSGADTQELWLWFFRRDLRYRANIFRKKAIRRLTRIFAVS